MTTVIDWVYAGRHAQGDHDKPQVMNFKRPQMTQFANSTER